MDTIELKTKEAELFDFVNSEIPDFCEMIDKAVNVGQTHILIHQDGFAADYQIEEYLLLGKAIKYAGLHNINITIIGKNRETF